MGGKSSLATGRLLLARSTDAANGSGFFADYYGILAVLLVASSEPIDPRTSWLMPDPFYRFETPLGSDQDRRQRRGETASFRASYRVD